MKTKAKIVRTTGLVPYQKKDGSMSQKCTIQLMLANDNYEYFDSRTGEKKVAYGRFTQTYYGERATEPGAWPLNSYLEVEVVHYINEKGYNEPFLREAKYLAAPKQDSIKAQPAPQQAPQPVPATPPATNEPGDELPF